MKKYILALAFLALGNSSAFAMHEVAPGVIAIEESGTAYLQRDGQNAVLVITGEAAKEIASSQTSNEQNSPVNCGENYCSIGQISRRGSFGPLTNHFASPNYFKDLIERILKPKSMIDAAYPKNFGSEIYAYPSQCQDENRNNLPFEEIQINGRVAEELYNFLWVKQDSGERVFGNGKSGEEKLIFCEKLPEMSQEDMTDNGVPIRNLPPAYTRYSCYLKVSKSGQLLPRQECHIYGGGKSGGGGSSAGGGG